jgi:hypothetical protein
MRIENKAESDFINVKGAQESIPPAHVAWRNRFLGSLSVYKFRARFLNLSMNPGIDPSLAELIPGLLKRLQIRALLLECVGDRDCGGRVK